MQTRIQVQIRYHKDYCGVHRKLLSSNALSQVSVCCAGAGLYASYTDAGWRENCQIKSRTQAGKYSLLSMRCFERSTSADDAASGTECTGLFNAVCA